MGLVRQTFRHTAVYSMGFMLGRLVGFVMLPFYAHVFEAQGYGVIALIDASLGLLVIAFSGGFQGAILRIYHEEGEKRGGAVIGTAMAMTAGLAAIAVVLPWIFSGPLSRVLLGDAQYAILLRLSLISFFIDVIGQSASAHLVIRQQSIWYSGIGLLRLFFALSVNIWLVFGLQLGLEGVFIGTVLSALLSTAFYVVLAARGSSLRVERSVARKLTHYQLPILPGDLIAFASRQAERYLVRFMIDIRAAGVLEMAYKFPPLLNMLVTLPFLKAWNSKCIQLAETTQDAPSVIGSMFTKYYFTVVSLGVLLALGIGDVLKILTPPDFWPAASIARVEILTTIASGANSFLLFGLVYRKRTGVISTLRAAAAIVKVPLALALITSFQLRGAAYSALVVEILFTASVLHMSQKTYRVQYEYGKLALISVYAAFVYLAVSLVRVPERVEASAFGHALTRVFSTIVGWFDFQGERAARFATMLTDREPYMTALVINIILAGTMFALAVYASYRSRNAQARSAGAS
jgi:O-antigen/teichoic acid export membrane protein